MSNQGFKRFDSQLLGFGESDSQGAWCKFQLEHDDLPMFRGRKKMTTELIVRFKDEGGNIIDPVTGQILVFNDEPEPEAEPEPPTHGDWWRKAIQSGMFWSTDPALFQALGNDKGDDKFREWVSSQPCIVSGGFDEAEDSVGSQILKNDFAHILRAEAKPSGKKGPGSNKPVYSGVPLQHEYHVIQHSDGWLGVAKVAGKDFSTEAEGSKWAMTFRSKLLEKWCGLKISEIFEVESRKDLDPKFFIEWCEKRGYSVPGQLR